MKTKMTLETVQNGLYHAYENETTVNVTFNQNGKMTTMENAEVVTHYHAASVLKLNDVETYVNHDQITELTLNNADVSDFDDVEDLTYADNETQLV